MQNRNRKKNVYFERLRVIHMLNELMQGNVFHLLFSKSDVLSLESVNVQQRKPDVKKMQRYVLNFTSKHAFWNTARSTYVRKIQRYI